MSLFSFSSITIIYEFVKFVKLFIIRTFHMTAFCVPFNTLLASFPPSRFLSAISVCFPVSVVSLSVSLSPPSIVFVSLSLVPPLSHCLFLRLSPPSLVCPSLRLSVSVCQSVSSLPSLSHDYLFTASKADATVQQETCLFIQHDRIRSNSSNDTLTV